MDEGRKRVIGIAVAIGQICGEAGRGLVSCSARRFIINRHIGAENGMLTVQSAQL